MTECLPALELSGSGLVIGDDVGLVVGTLAEAGVDVATWRRRVQAGHDARAWPEPGPYDFAVLRLPVSREAVLMALHAAVSRLSVGGRLLVYGANDEGIRSVRKLIAPLLGDVETVRTKWHCRAVQAVMSERPLDLKGELADWRREFTVELPDGELRWVSYPGVFAHGKLDDGTSRLLEALPPVAAGSRVLDFGCGVGLLSMAIRRRSPGAVNELLDVDALAVEAARENVPGARVVLSDRWSAVGDAKYDLVVSNPPIHDGKGQDVRVALELVRGARAHLNAGGELWMVAQRTVPVHEPLTASFKSVDIVLDENFRIWRARRAISSSR